MGEYTIDKIEYGGNVYKLQDNVSGYIDINNIPLVSATKDGLVPKSGTSSSPRLFFSTSQGIVGWENFEVWDNHQHQVGEYAEDEEGSFLLIYDVTTSASGLMTAADKSKLNGIASSAQVNVLEGIQVNGTDLTITNKKVNVTIPTKVSDLTNDSGYITSYTDEKVKWTVASVPASGTTVYYPLVNTSTATTSTLNTIAGFNLEYSATGTSRTLVLGHSTNIGAIKLYQGTSSSKSVTIKPSSDVSTDRTIQLPNASGTIALTSDIPDVSGFITSDSDEKVKVAVGSTNTGYYPVLATGAGTATRQYLSTVQLLDSSSYGTEFILGKNDGTSQGLIQLWSKTSGYYAAISPQDTFTANRAIRLPDKNGTIALTSDLSEYVSMGSGITNSFTYGSSTAKIGLRGLHLTDNISYAFRALATAPSLYNATNDTEIWRGYTTLNKPTASDIGAVPTSRTINGYALTSNITLGSADVGVGAYQAYTIQSTTVNTGASNYTALKLGESSQTGVTLSAGRYLIYASVQFPAATSGTYGAAVLKSGTALSSSRQKYGFTNTVQRIQTIGYSEFDGTDTFGIGAYQTGASSQAITGYAMWVRLRTN